jgi:hypothetical protein
LLKSTKAIATTTHPSGGGAYVLKIANVTGKMK